MKVVITAIDALGGESVYDVSERLPDVDDTNIQINIANEEEAFEQVANDVSLELSNLDGSLTEALIDEDDGSTRWRVDLHGDDDDNLDLLAFTGMVDRESIEFTPDTLYCRFSAFSALSDLWEQLDSIPIGVWQGPPPTGSAFFFTLQGIFNWKLSPIIGRYLYPLVDLGEFANKLIRGDLLDSTDPIGGNEGRFSMINPNMTWRELLEAMAIFYGAEWQIINGALAFRARREIDETRPIKEMQDRLLEDTEQTYGLARQKVYTYVRSRVDSFLPPPRCSPLGVCVPIPDILGGLLSNLTYSYYQLAFIGNNLDVPRLQSGRITVTMPANVPGLPAAWRISMDVPAGPSFATPITKRILLRLNPPNIGGITKVAEWYDNLPHFFTDFTQTNTFYQGFNIASAHDSELGWHRYNHDVKSWNPVLVEGIDPEPTDGEIFDAVPEILFRSSADDPNAVFDFSHRMVWRFFANDMTEGRVHERYQSLMVPQRWIGIGAKGIDYRVGDRINLPQPWRPGLSSLYRIESVSIDLLRQQSELEATAIEFSDVET